MKLATLSVTLKANGRTIEMPRYEFNHALVCLGEKVTPWGAIPSERLRTRLIKARNHMKLSPREFTACETTMSVGKDLVTFAALDVEKVQLILDKLFVFINGVGDCDVNF